MTMLGPASWYSGWVHAICFGTPESVGSDPGCRPMHCSLSDAVAASHIQNGGGWAQMMAQGQSSSSKKKKVKTYQNIATKIVRYLKK